MLGRALAYAYLGTSLWLAGYLYGHHVAEREGSGLEHDPAKWHRPDEELIEGRNGG